MGVAINVNIVSDYCITLTANLSSLVKIILQNINRSLSTNHFFLYMTRIYICNLMSTNEFHKSFENYVLFCVLFRESILINRNNYLRQNFVKKNVLKLPAAIGWNTNAIRNHIYLN